MTELADRQNSGEPSADSRLLRIAGFAVPPAVWLLLVVSPPRNADMPTYVATLTALLGGLALIERFGPGPSAPLVARVLSFAAELALCFAVVQLHGTYIRPALVYLIPATRAVMSFGARRGLVVSLAAWLGYGLNVGLVAWPDRMSEFPNYFSFFLAPYVVAVALTHVTVRQEADRSRLQSLYDQLRLAHEQLKALHQQTAELAVTQERNRLAREIHDALAHYLTVIMVQLEAAEKLTGQPNPALAYVQRSRRLASECLQEVRRSVSALRASTLDELSLPRALEKLAADFGATTGLAVDLDVALSDETRPAPETALALYRAAQEGLTNVQRHAHASRVRLSLGQRGRDLELIVHDNGVGFGNSQTESGERDGGFGLLGLQERVALLGGQVKLGQAPEGGARLSVLVPIAAGL